MEPLILSDITGSEDASGYMDFKVAGNDNSITAFQMDIKVGGITLPTMKQALLQARDGRKHILGEMLKCSPPPSKRISEHAPLIHVMAVKPDKVNLIFSSGGEKVKSIIEVKITARDLSSLENSKAIITSRTMVPVVGDIYRNCEIKSVAPYGAFVEIAPGREGLCHISELSLDWLEKTEDAFKVGDCVDVKLIEINEKGQLCLSRRALLPNPKPENSNEKQSTSNLTKDSAASQKGPDKSKTKKVLSTPKDGLAERNTERPKGRSVYVKPINSPKSKSAENSVPQDKFVKKLGSPAKDGPHINKDGTKDSSSKSGISISSKNESALINEEAKVG